MKVLVAEQIASSGIDLLRENFEVDVKTDLTPEELVAEIPAYDALIVRSATSEPIRPRPTTASVFS